MTIPAQWLDQLRDRTTLSTLISASGVPLKKKGAEWSACCPFHQEKSPSFYVNDSKGLGYCFGCHKHVDAISWLIDYQGLSFMDAVKELAAKAGMDVPESDPQQARRDAARGQNVGIMEKAAEFYAAALRDPRAEAANAYLASRGIAPFEISQFGIGFAPGSRIGDIPHAASFGSPEEVVRLGLVKTNPDDPSRAHDFFRNRVMIPIHNARGQCIAFGGRILGDAKPKYLNSPDTPLFDKGRTLFNLHRASPAARAKDRLIVVEGYMDVIGLASAGVTEAVAPNGTAMTEAQIELCWKLVDSPILCFDADPAGRKAALRAAEKALPLLKAGKGLRFVSPPDGSDPDDVARKGGPEAVSAMLSEPMSICDLLWQRAMDEMRGKGPDAAAGAKAGLQQLLGTITDPNVFEAYAADIGQRYNAYVNRRATTRHRAAPARQAVNDAVQDAIFKGVVKHIDRVGIMGEDLARVVWTGDDIRDLVDAIVWQALEGELTRGNFTEVLEQRGLGEKYRVAMARDTLRFPFLVGAPSDTTFRALLDTIRAQRAN